MRSPFVEQIGCGQIARDGEAYYCVLNDQHLMYCSCLAFKNRVHDLNSTVLDMWKRKTVARILCRSGFSSRVIPILSTGEPFWV